jgi:hypothetical protein
VNIQEAIQQAIYAAMTQPACVPHLPTGWFARADTALRHDHPLAMTLVALELVDAHAGYSASWDRWRWLDDLRKATAPAQAERRSHNGLSVWHPCSTSKPSSAGQCSEASGAVFRLGPHGSSNRSHV